MSGTSCGGSRELWYTCSYVPEEIILAAGFAHTAFFPRAVTRAVGFIPTHAGT